MPFWKTALQNRINNQKELSRCQALSRKNKKVSLRPSGSLTAEASLVLPVFLMVVMGFLFLFQVMIFQLKLQGAMDQAAQKAAAYYYAVDLIQKGEEDAGKIEEAGGIGQELLTGGITAAYLKTVILSQLNDGIVDRACVRGGKGGLVLLQSRFPDEDGAIDLVVRYEIKIPLLPGKSGCLAMSQRSRRMAWTGTRRWKDSGDTEEDQEEIVYVTEHGSVYHRDLNCSHLHLSIQSVAAADVEKMRNNSGGRYTSCEKCGSGMIGYYVYITNEGNRYHTSLKCSGLTRNIRQIPLSQAQGMPPCSRCGGGG